MQHKWLGGALALMTIALPARAADQVLLSFEPLQRTVAVADLEAFARTGSMTPKFASLANKLAPAQLAGLRSALGERFQVTTVAASQFMYSRVGELSLQAVGEVLRTEADLNGFQGLRAAVIAATAEPEGLTILNLLKKFPIATLRIDLKQALALNDQLQELSRQKEAIVQAILAQPAPTSPRPAQNLTKAGPYTWQVTTLTWVNAAPLVAGKGSADLYLPRNLKRPAPLIVISHGIASDHTTFAYLAQHLASWGFAVAAIDHPGSNAQRFRQFFDALVQSPDQEDFLSRPLEISQLLDRLGQPNQSWKGKLNLNQVGVLGQSKGGFTALALAGATLDPKRLSEDCTHYQDGKTSLNISLLLQCQAKGLTRTAFGDPRVKAVLALNPLDSSIMGPGGLGKIQIPVLILAGTDDLITPAVTEQIRPFSWLTAPTRYLVLLQHGTHFSALGPGSNKDVLPVPEVLLGPNAALARPGINALSTAFFMTYLAKQAKFQPYLSNSYLQSLNRAPFRFNIVRTLDAPKIQDLLGRAVKLEAVPSAITPATVTP